MLTLFFWPRWTVECFHGFPCPGVFIALLGFVAAGVTLRKEPSKPEKAFWLALFFCFLVLEVVAINIQRAHDNDEHATVSDVAEKRFDKTIERFTELQNLIVATTHARIIVQGVETQPVPNQPEQNARKQAAQLSSDILNFLRDRQANEPNLDVERPATGWTREAWQLAGNKEAAYQQGTINLYSHDFGAKVIAARDKLARYGIRDEQLDRLTDHPPVNPIVIRMLAERLGALALATH